MGVVIGFQGGSLAPSGGFRGSGDPGGLRASINNLINLPIPF